jgi:TadE-like protein
MAVMVPFLVIGMMGFLDLGRAFYFQIALTNAVREAARYAALPSYYGLDPSCNAMPPASSPGSNCPVPDDANVCQRLQQELANTGFNIQSCNAPDFQVSPAAGGAGGRVATCGTSGTCQTAVTVSAQYQFRFITPIIGSLIGDPLRLNTSATFRTEY